jgi:hypothetical protein
MNVWGEGLVVTSPGNNVVDKAGGMSTFKNGLIHFASFTKQIQKITLAPNLGILMGLETIKPIGKVLEEGKTSKSRYANMWQWLE